MERVGEAVGQAVAPGPPEHTAPPLPPPNGSPAWKSMPTAREVPDTGTKASDLSLGSRGIPRIPSCTEYRRKEPTPGIQGHFRQGVLDFCHSNPFPSASLLMSSPGCHSSHFNTQIHTP